MIEGFLALHGKEAILKYSLLLSLSSPQIRIAFLSQFNLFSFLAVQFSTTYNHYKVYDTNSSFRLKQRFTGNV